MVSTLTAVFFSWLSCSFLQYVTRSTNGGPIDLIDLCSRCPILFMLFLLPLLPLPSLFLSLSSPPPHPLIPSISLVPWVVCSVSPPVLVSHLPESFRLSVSHHHLSSSLLPLFPVPSPMLSIASYFWFSLSLDSSLSRPNSISPHRTIPVDPLYMPHVDSPGIT